MATARITITQSGVTGSPGSSRDDLAVGSAVTLRNADDSGVTSWRWLMVSRPRGSAATLSNVVAAQPTFTPDEPGSYLIQLTVNAGGVGERARSIAAVRNAEVLGIETRYIASSEDAEANWNVDLGGGAAPNTTGWWDDLDRWCRLVDALASSSASDWESVLAAGSTSGANSPKVSGEERLVSGYGSGPTAENNGIMWRTARRYSSSASGGGGDEQMGALLLGTTSLTESRLAIVKATCVSTGSRGVQYDLLEEIWDVENQARVTTVTSTGSGIFSFTSPNPYELAIQVTEHSGAGSTHAFAAVDITHLRYTGA